MKWTTWTVFALSLALALAVGAMVSRQSRTTPREFFAAVEKRITEGRYDSEQTLMNLDQVLSRALDAHDSELAARVQLRRGKMLMEMGAYERARADLQAVATQRPGDRAIEDDLVELDARSGDFHGAEERVKKILERSPGDCAGWVSLGRLYRLAADKTAALAQASLAQVLVAEDDLRTSKLVARSAALDPSDPRRVAIAHTLRELLGPAEEPRLEEVLKQLDQASLDIHSAREAYARSLELGFTSEALAGLIDLYERAGLTSQAVDLATSTLRLESVRSDPELGRVLLRALKELGRFQYAADFATQWVNRSEKLSGDFLADCCEVLYRAQRWQSLAAWGTSAPNRLAGIGSPAQIEVADLYRGLGFAGLAQWSDAQSFLRKYLSTTDPEPFPGAKAEGWRQLALASKGLGQVLAERSAIEAAIGLEPDADGELWLRLAELQMSSPHGGYRAPDARYAKGMSLLPARTAELLPRWHAIGALELSSIGLDPEAVEQDLRHGKIWTPASDASPYELYRLAQIHKDAGDYPRAAAHVKRLLNSVPGFVPAIDLALEIANASGKRREALEYALERLRLAGRSPAIAEMQKDVSVLDLAPKDRLAMMRADPEYTGRLVIATTLAQNGQRDLALSMLERLGFDSLGDEGRLLGARLYLEKQEYAKSLDLLLALGRGLYGMPHGDELFVDAALGAGAMDSLQTFTRDLARRGTAGAKGLPAAHKVRWFGIVDRLLARDATTAAMPLLLALDSKPATRDGDVVLRLAAAAMARGDAAAVRVALQRAQAFETHGRYELMNLLAIAAERRLDDLRTAASALAAAGFKAPPVFQAGLALLQDRADAVMSGIDMAVDGPFERDPLWNLTAAAAHALQDPTEALQFPPFFGASAAQDATLFLLGPDGERDPREALVLLLALRDPLGTTFLRSELARATPETHGWLWTAWLTAQSAFSLGSEAEAEAALQTIFARAPDFGPAWDLEERLAERAQKSVEEIADLRVRRLLALRGASGTPAELQLDRARILRQTHLPNEALLTALAALEKDPSSLEAQELVADLQAELGDDKAACLAYRDALEITADPDAPRPEVRDRLVRHLLAALGRVRGLVPPVLTRAEISALFSKLEKLLPDDPRIVLEEAKDDLARDPNNPSLAMARAYSRLGNFRDKHKGIALERLARGSAQTWADFLIVLDPDRAETFLTNELELEPGVLAPWIAMAHVFEARGQRQDALEALELAAKLAPGGDVLREILRLRSERDLGAEEIEASVKAVVAADGARDPDAELLLTAARAFLNLGPRAQARAIDTLDRLVASRRLSTSFAVRHGILFVVARLTRGKPEDLKAAADMLREIQPLVTDPYQRDFLLALQGLARPDSPP